jgi:hypothetical protein
VNFASSFVANSDGAPSAEAIFRWPSLNGYDITDVDYAGEC